MSPPTLEDDVNAWTALRAAEAKLEPLLRNRVDDNTRALVGAALKALSQAREHINARRQKRA